MLLPLYQRITNGFLASRALIEESDSGDVSEAGAHCRNMSITVPVFFKP